MPSIRAFWGFAHLVGFAGFISLIGGIGFGVFFVAGPMPRLSQPAASIDIPAMQELNSLKQRETLRSLEEARRAAKASRAEIAAGGINAHVNPVASSRAGVLQSKEEYPEDLERQPSPRASPEERIAAAMKPAKVNFVVPVKMSLGDIYEARLEVHSASEAARFVAPPDIVISENVQMLTKANATIASAFFKIERLSDEWQETLNKPSGVWLWRVQPIKAGKTELIVTVSHAGTVNGTERTFVVERFPKTVEIEVGLFQRILGSMGDFGTQIGTIASIVTVIGSTYGFYLWLRSRRKKAAQPRRKNAQSPQS